MKKTRAAKIQDSICQILRHDWDPIGLGDVLPEDEYDSYIAPVYRILVGSRSEEEIAQFLYRTWPDIMGVPCESMEQLRLVARKLLALDVVPPEQTNIGDEIPTITLYRSTGPEELELVAQSGFRRWPQRLPEQPIFYLVTNEQYATEIAIKWNTEESGVGYVTRFCVKKEFMDRFKIERVGAAHHTEWWIPAEQLEKLNDNIVGLIEVIGEYHQEV